MADPKPRDNVAFRADQALDNVRAKGAVSSPAWGDAPGSQMNAAPFALKAPSVETLAYIITAGPRVGPLGCCGALPRCLSEMQFQVRDREAQSPTRHWTSPIRQVETRGRGAPQKTKAPRRGGAL